MHQLNDILDERHCIRYLRNCLRLSDKVRKLNSAPHDVLSVPNFVIKKGPSHGACHGNAERQLIYHATHLSSQKAKKKEYKSVLDRFLKSLRCRMDRRTLRTPWMRSRSKITPTSLRRQSAPDVKILWSFCSAAQVRTAPWISEKMTKKPKELKNDFIKSLEKMTQDFIPVSKFDSDQVNHSPGTMKALSVSTHRQAGGGTTRTLQPALPPRDGNRLRGGNLLHGHRHQVRVNDNLSQSQGASLTGNGDSLVSDGVCKQDTKPTHTSHSRTRYFSRLAQDLSHRVRNRCVSQNSHSSHLAQRVPRAFVFFLHTCVLPHFPHTLLSDLRPDHLPHLYLRLLHMEIYPAQIHRMCLSISWLKRSRLQVMSPRISLKRRTLYWSYRCSSTDRAWRRLMIQLRALRLSLQNPIWMMGEYVICWLYSCTYRREKQVPTDHDLITLSEKTQCQVHLTSEKSAGKPAAMFSHNRKSSLKTPSDRQILHTFNVFMLEERFKKQGRVLVLVLRWMQCYGSKTCGWSLRWMI